MEAQRAEAFLKNEVRFGSFVLTCFKFLNKVCACVFLDAF